MQRLVIHVCVYTSLFWCVEIITSSNKNAFYHMKLCILPLEIVQLKNYLSAEFIINFTCHGHGQLWKAPHVTLYTTAAYVDLCSSFEK